MTIAYRDLDTSEISTEDMANLVSYAFSYIDYCEAGGKEPRKTARYKTILETRKGIVAELKTMERKVVEVIYRSALSLQIQADRALRERISNGENPAIPAAKRASRRKSRPVSGT